MSDLQRFRDTAAFALQTCEAAGVELWSLDVSAGGSRLALYIAEHDAPEVVRKLAGVLGVGEDLAVENLTNEGRTFTVHSRGRRPAYVSDEKWQPPRSDYAGASVPLGDRLIEVSVTCSMTVEHPDGP